jgi:alpha-amylase
MNVNYERLSWLPQATIYEVNIRQYTSEGSINAFRKHIPRLNEMGVTVLWVMPIFPIGVKNRKGTLGSYYSVKDFKAINPEFGSFEDFIEMVKEAHYYEMKVIIDWVANHTSWDNHWITAYPDYYAKNENGNFFSPYDWSDVVQLNHQNEAQIDAMISAMEFWVNETHIDGFRCDMAHLVPLNFWRKARLQLEQHKPLLWLAETQDTPYFEVFDIIYGWQWLHQMEDYYKSKINIEGLDGVIQSYYQEFKLNKFRLLFTSNHDENSWQGTEYDRLGDAAQAFATLCITLIGIPLIYSGQEEPIKKKISFFEKDAIVFKDYNLHIFYKKLMHIKKNHPALGATDDIELIRLNTSANNKILAYLRKKGTAAILIIANMSNSSELACSIMDDRLEGGFKPIITEDISSIFNNTILKMNAWTVSIYEK